MNFSLIFIGQLCLHSWPRSWRVAIRSPKSSEKTTENLRNQKKYRGKLRMAQKTAPSWLMCPCGLTQLARDDPLLVIIPSNCMHIGPYRYSSRAVSYFHTLVVLFFRKIDPEILFLRENWPGNYITNGFAVRNREKVVPHFDPRFLLEVLVFVEFQSILKGDKILVSD